MSEKKNVKKTKESEREKERKAEEREETREEVINRINRSEEKEEKKEEHEKPSKEQIQNESKMLFWVLGVLGAIILIAIGVMFLMRGSQNFTLNGVPYSILKEGQLTFYGTKIPQISANGQRVDYNIYIQNDPRTLEKNIPFNGSVYIRPGVAINMSNSLACHGNGAVAIVNLNNIYKNGLLTTLINDSDGSVPCDSQARYVFVNIQPSNVTNIEQTSMTCYNINVANCQVLPAVERYMAGLLETYHEYANNVSQSLSNQTNSS